MGPSSYRKARPASVSSSGFHSQQRRRLTYSQPTSIESLETFNGDMTRRSEKEILQALNDRFAGYIDKVRNLEMHNRNLEAEAAALRQSQAGRISVGEHYERELNDLRGLLQQLTGEKTRAALEHEHLEEDIQHLRVRLEDEARSREELEAAARAMKKYVEECRLTRLELDKKLRALEEEAAFLKKNHEEEVAELLAQIQGTQVSFDLRDTLKADVTSALREIRSQLDSHASKSAVHAEEWFKGEAGQRDKFQSKSCEVPLSMVLKPFLCMSYKSCRDSFSHKTTPYLLIRIDYLVANFYKRKKILEKYILAYNSDFNYMHRSWWLRRRRIMIIFAERQDSAA